MPYANRFGLLVLLLAAWACAGQTGAPGEIDALIEIPAGSAIKYELDPLSGRMRVDRFQSMPVAYPANYGALPASLAGDGDELDVLVYTREPVYPGSLIRVRPIGVLRMTDGGEQDDKIVAVPADDVDPAYSAVRDITDLPAIEIDRLLAFFRVYKELPEGRKRVEIHAVEGQAKAAALVAESRERFTQN